ncbi:MAG: PD-(D/E)XK nuclease family protein, partial [Gammaproteobacteria bacterium]|nr:PD-(D/E)XK nuclease family protein [Gammaproteobacteria bacterium]
MTGRQTWLVHGPVARQTLLLQAARGQLHGCQILSMPQVAARLAGGRLAPATHGEVLARLQALISERAVELGDLEPLRHFPGFPHTLTLTLNKLWLADLRLAELLRQTASEVTVRRLHALQGVELALLAGLSPRSRPPPALAQAALGRVHAAAALLGSITLKGVPDIDPVWRVLLTALAQQLPVVWEVGHAQIPTWLAATHIEIRRCGAARGSAPAVQPTVESCASPSHEALEALRWARELIANGRAAPQDIAFCAPVPAPWDDYFAVLAHASGVPLAFVHGHPALATRAGQSAAALAEVLLAGLSRSRVRRLFSLLAGQSPRLAALPRTWHESLPSELPLERWEDWAAHLGGGRDAQAPPAFVPGVLDILRELAQGPTAAAKLGPLLLSGQALAVWERALQQAGIAGIHLALARLRVPDDTPFGAAVLWGTTDALAASPRPWLRLLGLTNAAWPRPQREDPLLPAHMLDPLRLDPVSLRERDTRDFTTLCQRGERAVVLSFSRRDESGQQTGQSHLLGSWPVTILDRGRVPPHAATPADRALARPAEFKRSPRGHHAHECWRNWQRASLTPHDGLLSAAHPSIERALQRPLSATALVHLLRDLPGYVWKYGLGWQAPRDREDARELPANELGTLTHRVLEIAVAGLGSASDETALEAALQGALAQTFAQWEYDHPIPALGWWRLVQKQAAALARTGLQPLLTTLASVPPVRRWTDVSFGDARKLNAPDLPWNPAQAVSIPGLNVLIRGKIDRLDLSDLPGGATKALLTDYKTGDSPPGGRACVLRGGAEVQRALYRYAVTALLAPGQIAAQLHYLKDDQELLLEGASSATDDLLI